MCNVVMTYESVNYIIDDVHIITTKMRRVVMVFAYNLAFAI